jgi:hypothetical protein
MGEKAKAAVEVLRDRQRLLEPSLGDQQLEPAVAPVAGVLGGVAGIAHLLERAAGAGQVAALAQQRGQERDATDPNPLPADLPERELLARGPQRRLRVG